VLPGLLLGVATSVFWALGNVFIQKSGRVAGAARALVWALAVGGALSAVAAVFLDRRTEPLGPAIALWTAAAGLSGVSAYAFMFHAFARAKLSLAVPFLSSWTLVAAFFSMVVFGEAVAPLQWGGAAVVVAGVSLVSVGAARAPGASSTSDARSGGRRPLLAALASGISFGVMVPTMGRVAPALGAFGTAAAVYGVGLALAAPLARLTGQGIGPPPRGAWAVVAAAGVFETLGFVSITAARRFAPTAVVAPIASLASALTVLYAWLVLRERPHPLALAGALAASLGVVLLSR
jgi:drug/metabolite transporter (DMT)-like permease